jgi:hypothetical protein
LCPAHRSADGPDTEGVWDSVTSIASARQAFVAASGPSKLERNISNAFAGNGIISKQLPERPTVPAIAKLVPLMVAGKVGSWSLLSALIKVDSPLEIYNAPLVRAVVEAKWQCYACSMMVVRGLIYFRVSGFLALYQVSRGPPHASTSLDG